MSACAIGPDGAALRERVRAMYEAVAGRPGGSFHFHRGLEYAVGQLGYERAELEMLPERCTARFAGVGNPHRAGTIAPGATVLDHACGAGMDLLLAARRVGPGGRSIGVDMTEGMRVAAAAAALEAGLEDRVEIRDGVFEALPVADGSVDYVLSNGVLNLAPDKAQVLAEVRRVLRPGGWLYLADVVLDRELAPEARASADLWAACVGGALTEATLRALLGAEGFTAVTVVKRYDCFRGTSVARKFAGSLRAGALSLRARRA